MPSKAKAKVRKPKHLVARHGGIIGRLAGATFPIYLWGIPLHLSEAKAIRDWLTRAIEWLEAQQD